MNYLTTAEHFPIRTLASLTGVLPVTLRAWERRYGLIRPKRTPAGHRYYTREHVDLIHRVLALTAKGVPISDVPRALAGTEAVPAAPRASGAWAQHLDRMAQAIAQFDEAMLDETYDSALALHPIASVTRNLLMPLLAELGRRWERAAAGVAEEHFFAVYLRNKLGARLHHRRALAGPRLLLACAPGEQHEIGLLLFALAAHEAGLRSVTLGADMPIAELGPAALRAGCRAIVLSSSLDPAPAMLSKELPGLVAQARIPVCIGGQTSVRRRDAVVAAGAIPLGTDIEAGVQRVQAALDGGGRTR